VETVELVSRRLVCLLLVELLAWAEMALAIML
jgi:hypothetical protein